jgi:gluconolactonase
VEVSALQPGDAQRATAENVARLWLGVDHAEGIAVDAQGRLWCGGEAGQIYHGVPDCEPREVARVDGVPLGFAVDGHDNAYCCVAVEPTVCRISPAGDVATLVLPPGRKLVSPNHPAFLVDGRLFFTDSGNWGQDDGALVLVDGDEVEYSAVSTAFPNGCAAAPDGESVFVVESCPPALVRITVGRDGIGEREMIAGLPGVVPDGVAVDECGVPIVSCWAPDVILICDPVPRILVADPLRMYLNSPTNIAFVPGTSTLVVANVATRYLTRLEHSRLGFAGFRPGDPHARFQ